MYAGNTILLLDNADSMMNPRRPKADGDGDEPNPSYREFCDAMRTITKIPNPRLKIIMTSPYHLDMKARLTSKVCETF